MRRRGLHIPPASRACWRLRSGGFDDAGGNAITWAASPTFDADGVTLNGTDQYGYIADNQSLDLHGGAHAAAGSFWPTGLAQGHLQGAITADGTNFYIAQTAYNYSTWQIDKCTAAGSTVTNADPFDGLPDEAQLNHVGPLCFVSIEGTTYVVSPNYHVNGDNTTTYMTITWYDATTLAYVGHWVLGNTGPDDLTSIGGMAWDGATTFYFASYINTTRIWKYSITGDYLGYITLDTAVANIQGISINAAAGEMYVTSDGAPEKAFSLTGTFLYNIPTDLANGNREGIHYCAATGLCYLGQDAGSGNTHLIKSYNPAWRLNTTPGFTVWAWVNPSTVTGEHVILSRYAYTSNMRQYVLEANVRNVQFRAGYGANAYAVNAGANALTIGSWTLAVGLYDAVAGTVNAASAPLGGAITMGTPVSTAGNLCRGFSQYTGIGCAFGSNTLETVAVPFAGTIAQIGVVPYVMTAAEIAALLARGYWL